MTWQERAACIPADPRPFDQPSNQLLTVEQRDQIDATINRYCMRCPVRKDCLEAAIKHSDVGIRGGVLITDEGLRKLRMRIKAAA